MIRCPVCKKIVSLLKTNSHIIPKWILNIPKVNGKALLLKNDRANYQKKTIQHSFKDDIVCDKCERMFAENDSHLTIFRDKFSYVYPAYDKVKNCFLLGNRDDYFKIKKAIMSIHIRTYLFIRKNPNCFLKEGFFLSKNEFNFLLNLYMNKKNSIKNFLFYIESTEIYLPKTLSYPERQNQIINKKKQDLLHIQIFGLNFMIFLSENPPDLSSLFAKYIIQSNDFIARDVRIKNVYIDEDEIKDNRKLNLKLVPKIENNLISFLTLQ